MADNNNFYRNSKWRKLRLKVLEMDGWKCCVCGGEACLVHHVHHRTEDPEHAYSIYLDDGSRNLVSICRYCHDKLHPENSELRKSMVHNQKRNADGTWTFSNG